MILSRPWFRFLLIFTGSLSLFLTLSHSSAFAKIEQWNFEDKNQYQFDSQKIQLKDKTARLTASEPYRDHSREDFDKGTYDLNTASPRGFVELTPLNIYETAGPEVALPLSNLEPGMAALWHFDEPNGTNVLDEASRTVAKTSDTETVSSQMGFGFSRAFDGVKSHVFIPHYETFKFERALTLELWIRPQVTINAKPQTLVSRWQQVGAQKSFAFQISPEGKLDFVLSPDGALSKHHTGETVLAPGVWYHVAAVYNGEDIRVYLNGVLDSVPTLYGDGIHPSTNPIYIGSLINSTLDEFYKGSMDEVAFYSRPLTETELLTHAGNSRALVGLWHLNERGGPLADTSGFGQHAAAVQKPDYEAEGKLGTGIHFDGKKQYLEVPATSRFSANGALTLQAWVKPEKTPGAGQTSVIVASSPDFENPEAVGRGEFSLFLSGPDGTLKAMATSVNPVEIKGRTPLMPNVWQHVAVTWAQGRVQLYVNGVLDASDIYKGVVHSGKSGLRIGMDAKGLAPFSGTIDEVAVYRRARTQNEIAADAGGLNSGGIYTSSVKDAGSDSEWRTFSWKEPIPYGKGLSSEEVGLLHLYHLDEKDQGVFTDLKGDIQASAVGTYSVGGNFSQARWFQTKGLDKIISQKNFPSLSTFTLSLWFQFASSQPGLSDRLFSIGDSNPTAFRAEDGRLHVSMPGAREIVSQSSIRDTRWHSMALSADGRNLFLYIDGMLDGNSPFISATAEAPLILGNLKSLDTFQGAIDEVAFFNAPLNRETILEHYLRGKMNLSFQVRTSNDFAFSGIPWRNLNGTRRSDTQAEAYTVGLWHLNDLRYFGRSQEVTDASRFSNHGMTYGRITVLPTAASDAGISLNGSSDFIRVPDAENLHVNAFTLSAWIKPHQIQEEDAVILDKQYQKGAPAFSSYALELVSGNRLNVRLGYSRGYTQVQTDLAGEITADKWNHVAATYNGKEIKLYINGMLKKIAPFQESLVYDNGPLYLGRYGASPSRFFNGDLDEVNIQAKALEPEEISEVYEALRPQSIPVTEGKLDIERGRYFEYRAVLNAETPAAGPLFQETEIRANLFSTDRPAVSNLKGVSYADISHFSEKLGAGNRGAVSYQLSNDGANWFYHNGRRWVIASGYSESNTADQIQTRVHDFAKEVGIGSFYFKAFLHSPTGLEPVELEDVEVEYLPNKLTLTSPNGGEAWITGSDHSITWNSTGEVQKVSLEYSDDDFKSDFHSIAKKISNTGSYTWKVPEDPSTQLKVRVLDALGPRVYDVSDLSFRVAGSLELISPNWNEQWEVGSSHDIVWTTNGKIANVKLELSTDDFVKAIFPIIDSAKNTGKFSWKVTDPISQSVKVRVSDVRDPLTFDKSNDTFAIHGRINILSPAAGARWIVGSTQEVRWENVGIIPAVSVEYQTSKKDEWIPIAPKAVNENKISWKVPDDIDGKVKIRVTDLNDAKAVSVTSPEFSIIGGLRLENPGGGENWTIGSRRKISWQTVGTIPAVNLQYKLASQNEWIPITQAIANTGSYIWDIPEQPADLVAVRVVDAADATIDTQSVTPSRIIPTFILKSPNGGESLRIGSDANITWETLGKVDHVKLDYSQDNFVNDVRTIIASASNIGGYVWTVPDYAGAKVKVRVSAADLPSAQDASDGDFRIFPGFKFTAPEGGEKYEVGSLATLEWETTGTVPEVRLEYSHDDFSKDVRVAANSIPNQGRYTWTVPDDIGSGYSFRISDVRDLKAQDFSQGFFSIIGNFRILEPVGGESYTAGAVTPIKWKGAGSVPFVRIDYSEDGFEKTFQTLAEQAPNTGSYDWLVPNLIGHEFKIRIWDPSHPDAQDMMSSSAKIIGGFRLLAPNGGEVIYVGDSVDVKWEVLGTVPTVKIQYSQDHFNKNIGEIADAYENTGTYHWQVPDLPTGSYLLKISDPRDSEANDISNGEFKVRSRFTLLSPNGGEGWLVGEKKTITWQTTGSVPAVNLEYSIDDFASSKTIAEKAPNTGSYEWVIPDQVAQTLKVRVSDVKDFEASDVSDGAFRIQGVLNLVSPAGGEIWRVGEQRAIEWKTTGRVEGVRIEYSHDDFASEVKTITDSILNTGSYNWTVPDMISENTKVRVLDLKDLRTYAVSPEPFQIAASFRLMAPNGGERWHASEKREITWATIGTVKEVNLEYSKDDFKTAPETIDRGVLNTGKFTWELPRDLGDAFKVRVCDADQPKNCDAGDGLFSLEPPFEFLAPKGGELWPVGSEQELRWNLYGYVPRVFLQYSVQDPPVEWKTLISELPNEGHLLFKTPDDISKTVYFRVSDFEDADVYTVTQKPVQIIGTFQVLTPNGGEKWIASSIQKITWNTLGTAPEVRLEYSIDDFKRDVKLIESSYKNTGTYDWKIPADLAPAVKVRVKDAGNDASFDISDASFKIIPHFSITSPNGGERWISGDKVQIQWLTEGSVPRIRLDYGTREAGQDAYSWQPLAEVRGNLQSYDWVVPSKISSDAKIRIYDERDAETTDESDAPFKTLARFKVLTPRPEEILTVDQKYAIKWETAGEVPSVKLEYLATTPSADGAKAPAYQAIENFWANSGIYYWTVPDASAESIALRISDAREPDAAAIGETFKIRGALKFDMPEGDLRWVVGSRQTLRWKTTGTISNVKLEYSIDGKNWKLIEESLPNSGSYGWLVPDDLSMTARLRVSNVQNPAVFTEFDRTVTILGEFEFIAPQAGEKWTAESKQTIRWKTTGSVKRAWLDYTVNGKDWMTLAGPIENQGVYEWTVPDAIAPALQLRIKDPDNPAASALSQNFGVQGRLELNLPAGGEIWEVGSTKTIQWKTTGTIPFVRIEGYWDGGPSPASQPVVFGPQLPAAMQPAPTLGGASSSEWFIISAQEENRGHYDWTVPDKIGDHLKIRITDTRDASVSAVSAQPFSIIGTFHILSPNGTEVWTVGDQQQIVWTSQGAIPDVLLEYSRDDFYRDVSIIASGVPNTGAALWVVPDAISDQLKVRISDMRDKRATDLSNSFRIQGKLGFIVPAKDEVMKVASKHMLHWKTTGSIPRVRLEYSRDDFHHDVQVIENNLENQDSYEWQIPDIVSSTVALRVMDLRDASVSAVSSPFRVEGTLLLKSPAGQEKLQTLSEFKILWDTIGTVEKVRLEYSRDDFAQDIHMIAQEAPNQGFYDWIVPDDIGPGVKVRVSSAANFSVWSVSPDSFLIHGALSFTMMPAAAGRWPVASAQTLSWQTLGTIPHVKLEYSKDDFQKDIQVIAEKQTNENKYEWIIPDDISANVRFRVSDARDGNVFAVTDIPVAIVGQLDLVQPAKDSVLNVADMALVKWNTVGSIPGVRLEYQTVNDGKNVPEESWSLITGLLENTGEYHWSVPNAIGLKTRVRVSDARDAQTFSLSPEFAIVGKLSLLAPSGGERWIVGTSHELLWQSVGTVTEVDLQFSSDGFVKDIRKIADKVSNSGRVLWTVPDAISNQVQIRIQDSRMPERVSNVSLPVSIVGDFVMGSPLTPVTWKVGSEVRLEWQTVGTIPSIKLEYLYPKETGTRMLQDQVPNQGYYAFRVPDWIGDGGQIRISDVRDTQVAQLFPPSKIEGVLEFVRPLKNEVWSVDRDQVLEWHTTGTIPSVILEYSSDHFQQDIKAVQPLTENKNRFLWTVPDVAGSLIFRVRDARDEKVSALSEEVKIRSVLQILYPQTQDVFTVGTNREIMWKTSGTVPLVRLDYSLDGFQKDIHLIEEKAETTRLLNQDGIYSYLWQVPDSISEKVQVRVSDVRDEKALSISEPFKVKGSFEMVLPQGKEQWTVGSVHEIAWKTVGTIPKIRLEYSRDGFKKDVQLIASNLENSGRYPWTVVDAVHSHLWVRAVDEQDPSVWASHSEPVEVQGALSWVNPKGGETWKVGETVKLQWENTGTFPEVKLEYMPVGAEDQKEQSVLIAAQIPNQGYFNWELPDTITPRIKLRVTDAGDSEVSASTEVPNLILGVLKVTSPDVSAVWPIGSTQEIVWESRGFIPQVKVEASRDDFQQDIQTLFPLLPNTGSVKWTVADLISKNFKVRVSDAQNTQVSAVSQSPVEIMGGFQVLTPEPGAVLEVGAKEEISWKTVGTIRDVRLEYSSDRFNHPSVIAEKIPNTGRFQWQVPDTIGDHFQIRVSDIQHPEMAAFSDAPFSIQGRLVLQMPHGGEIWKVASDVDIQWGSIGSIPQVTLEYSMDDFVHTVPIVQNLSNTGHYTWRIPDIVSEKVKVRVRDSQRPEVFSASIQPLKIQGSLTVLTPQAGEFWEMGTQHTLLWQTVGSIPFVSIEYSSDNFATAVPAILGVANNGRYQWTVPDLDAESLKFRISDAHDNSVFAVSPPLEIGGTLKMLSPQGGEAWRVGDEAVIKWNTGGTIPRVRIEVSTDDFKNVIQTLESSAANNGTYTWKVPDQIASSYRVRVTDAGNPRISDISKGVFKITGALTILSPKGGEKWAVGSSQTIEWQNLGTLPAVRLEYTKNNFADTVPISTNLKNTGRFTWEVPDLAGEKIQFRVSDALDPSVSDSMIASLDVKPVLSLTSPKGKEIWMAQESRLIAWKTTGTVPNVNLEYSVDGFNETKPIASSIANTGSFLWTVPDISARRLTLRVVDSLDTRVFSELAVPVQVQGEIKVTSPVGGEIWLVGSSHPITWVSTGKITRVRLEYSTDGFRTAFPVAVSLPNEGRYDWTVPDAISKEGRIRVVHDEDSAVFGQNDKTFEIRGALNLLTGVGGEVWIIGSRHPISWQNTGTIPQVRLEYSTDGFVSDIQTIVPTLDNKGVYYWEVPSVPAPGIKLRVLDPNHPDVFDISRSNVNLQGELQLLSPAGGESYQVGERTEILWRATPNIANVKLEYSLDNFETSKVISDYLPNTGKFVWNIPNQISSEWRVRVSDALNQTVFSFSKFPFTTRGALEMISPKGGELWPAGSKQTLSWNTLGSIPKVRIEYSSDNFNSSLPIATSTDNQGNYIWTVPEIPYPEIRLRVTAAETPSVFSTSQGPVNIVGKLEIVTPAAGERWVVGEERVIRWQTAGYMPQVDLEYSKDNFAKDVHLIAAKIPNVGSYSWTVPNDPSTGMRLRIRNSENSKITAVSESPFLVNYFQIRWMVRDAENKDHLSGLVMTDSTGKTISRGASPSNFEYPYGIYTTVWTKPGYAEYRSTWLADRDRAFEVLLEPQTEKIEIVRASFDYDRAKDFMNISAWYEKDSKMVPAVIQAEVKIYKNNELIKALTSTTPDSAGSFHMLWDTTMVEGNEKYFASVAVTTASGQTLTSPISYQLDIPVKEKKDPEVRHAITSMFLRPLGLSPSSDLPKTAEPKPEAAAVRPLPSTPDKTEKNSKETVPNTVSLQGERPEEVSAEKRSFREEPQAMSSLFLETQSKAAAEESQLIVPKSAVMHETVSVTYVSDADVRPVLDMYDANRKLVLRAQPMNATERPGTFSYLIPVKGLHFIPGKTVRVSVIELATGKFKSAEMIIVSSPAALGYEKQAGGHTVLEILQYLDVALREVRRTDTAGHDFSEVLKTLNNTITNLAGLLSEESLDPKIFQKFNEIAENLAAFAQRKGYSGDFVVEKPLTDQASLEDVTRKMRDLKSLIQSLQRLYDSASSGASS